MIKSFFYDEIKVDFTKKLPKETVKNVIEFCQTNDVNNLCLVNKTFNKTTKETSKFFISFLVNRILNGLKNEITCSDEFLPKEKSLFTMTKTFELKLSEKLSLQFKLKNVACQIPGTRQSGGQNICSYTSEVTVLNDNSNVILKKAVELAQEKINLLVKNNVDLAMRKVFKLEF
jgi:hypothetical protein